MMKIKGNPLHDWSKEGVSPMIIFDMTMLPEGVTLTFQDGRMIWVEYQDGVVRVHCYQPGNDAPVNVEIQENQIEVDMHDYHLSQPLKED